MKKILAILLVALLAVSSVFALEFTLGGNASTEFAYNLDKKTLGFSPATEVTAQLGATTKSTENEGDWYAVLKARLTFTKVTDTFALTDDKFEITDATLTNGEWAVSILSADGVATYATSWEPGKKGDDAKTVEAATGIDAAPGITVSNSAFAVGVGMDMDFNKDAKKDFSLSATLKDTDVADGLKLGATAGVSSKTVLAALPADSTSEMKIAAGAKVAFANDDLSATVAADFNVVNNQLDKTAKSVINMDVAAKVEVSLVTVDAYFSLLEPTAGKAATVYGVALAEKWLSARVIADLNEFEVPVKLTVEGVDLINSQYLKASAAFALDAVSVGVYGGYHIKETTVIAGADVSYEIENIGTLAANVDSTIKLVKDADAVVGLSAGVSVTNTTLVTGATLKAGWKSGDLLTEDATKAKLGKIYASAKIAF